MGSRIIDVTVSTLITVLMIYLLKWVFVRQTQVPFLTEVLKEI